MKKTLIIGCALAVAGSANAQDILGNASKIWEGSVAIKADTGLGASDVADVYSNKTNFVGQAFSNGGTANQAGNLITRLVADNLVATQGNVTIDAFTFSVANLNTVAVSARPRVRFYADNAGTPGTYLTGFSFNAISFTAGSVGLFNFASPAMFTTAADGKFWAAITFDNNTGATGATQAQMDLLGQGIFNPPTVGSSADSFWLTTAAGSFLANNPAGASTFFNGNPVANFGWSFTSNNAVPEPASMIAIGLGIAGLAAKRRRKNS